MTYYVSGFGEWQLRLIPYIHFKRLEPPQKIGSWYYYKYPYITWWKNT